MSQLHLNINMPPVTPDTALELMTHHLQLAAAYYEIGAGRDGEEHIAKEEMLRIMRESIASIKVWRDDGSFGKAVDVKLSDTPAIFGAIVWFDRLTEFYTELRKQD